MQMAVPAGAPKTESAAWALTQLGNLYFNTRRVDEAAKQYEAALRAFNGYHLALAALGKVRAAQGRYDDAISLYQQAVNIIPQPVTLAALGDLYAKTGNMTQAQLQYDTVEVIAKLAAINQQIYNRELSLFYSDHDIKLAEALELATKELAVRGDIYGHDALAWALYKNNRLDEAAAAITEAMKLGTQDANLYYHAGMIYYRLGQKERAQEYLEHALALNPHFSLLQSDRAKETLAELGGGK
jgi:tetratricopeptide (TPR) repeat protein